MSNSARAQSCRDDLLIVHFGSFQAGSSEAKLISEQPAVIRWRRRQCNRVWRHACPTLCEPHFNLKFQIESLQSQVGASQLRTRALVVQLPVAPPLL